MSVLSSVRYERPSSEVETVVENFSTSVLDKLEPALEANGTCDR